MYKTAYQMGVHLLQGVHQRLQKLCWYAVHPQRELAEPPLITSENPPRPATWMDFMRVRPAFDRSLDGGGLPAKEGVGVALPPP